MSNSNTLKEKIDSAVESLLSEYQNIEKERALLNQEKEKIDDIMSRMSTISENGEEREKKNIIIIIIIISLLISQFSRFC